MSTITKRKISSCHFFRIIYSNGTERWVAFDTPDGPKLAVSEVKRLVQKTEVEAASEQQGVVWYGEIGFVEGVIAPKESWSSQSLI
jgi:hypothetical protein